MAPSLTKMPAEIKDEIYGMLLTNKAAIKITIVTDDGGDLKVEISNPHEIKLDISIMFVNTSTHDEAARVLYGTNTFLAPQTPNTIPVFTKQLGREAVHLRRIQLATTSPTPHFSRFCKALPGHVTTLALPFDPCSSKDADLVAEMLLPWLKRLMKAKVVSGESFGWEVCNSVSFELRPQGTATFEEEDLDSALYELEVRRTMKKMLISQGYRMGDFATSR